MNYCGFFWSNSGVLESCRTWTLGGSPAHVWMQWMQQSARMTVPGGPSVACSTAAAIAWDKAWAGNLDPSGRAALGVHDSAYTEKDGPTASLDNNGHAENGTSSSSTYSPLSKPTVFDATVLKTQAMVHWCMHNHGIVIAFSVASGKRVKGDFPPTRTKTKEEAQCGFCVEAPKPTMVAQQAERPVREEGGASPPVWD